tara:strand:+ start:935 stop:1558 length:624 start_codon:yes stop_codon:yes gene_type:complete
MKKLLLIITILTIFGCSNPLNWKKSPEYSLLQVKESIENNDIYLFEKHFDIDRVSDRMSDEIIKYLKEESLKNTDTNNEWELLGNNFASGIIELMKPLISSKISKNIRKTIDDMGQNEPNSNNDPNDYAIFNSYDFDFMNQNTIGLGIMSVFKSNNISLNKKNATTSVIIELNENGKSYNLEVILNKYEDYWRVTEIKNLYLLMMEQ